jgi:hypothetical protein
MAKTRTLFHLPVKIPSRPNELSDETSPSVGLQSTHKVLWLFYEAISGS